MRGDVQVEIEGFFIECGGDGAIVDADGYVKEVNVRGEGFKFPLDTMVGMHIKLEPLPISSIFHRVWAWYPYTTDVVNVSFVADDVGV